MLRTFVKQLPGIRSLVADRDLLQLDRDKWKLNQSFPPGHYYSPIPDTAEIQSNLNSDLTRKIDNIPGIKLYWNEQISLFRKLSRFYGEIPFSQLATDSKYRYHYENGFYSYADGIILYSFLRYLRPQRLIEVGSGFSSCLTLDVNDHFLGGALKCTFIEPYPERLLENLHSGDEHKISIIQKKVQDVDFSVFSQLAEGDILFIDSSHVSKSCSDVNFLVFEVLPQLNPGVWIHFHDIFYPFEYPKEWILTGRSWNEAYLVRALLMCNAEFQIRLWLDALAAQHRAVVQSTMPLCLKNIGASIWLQKVAS